MNFGFKWHLLSNCVKSTKKRETCDLCHCHGAHWAKISKIIQKLQSFVSFKLPVHLAKKSNNVQKRIDFSLEVFEHFLSSWPNVRRGGTHTARCTALNSISSARVAWAVKYLPNGFMSSCTNVNCNSLFEATEFSVVVRTNTSEELCSAKHKWVCF